MIIIIPIGGIGERFSRVGYKDPKPLIMIHHRTILQYLLDSLETYISSGDQIIIFHHNELQTLHDFIQQNYPSIQTVNIGPPTKGAVETIQKGLQRITIDENEPVLLLDCDTFYTVNIIEQLCSFMETSISSSLNSKNDRNAVFCFEENEPSGQFSYIRIRDERITQIKEKEVISSMANTGAYFFRSVSILDYYAKKVLDEDRTFRHEYYTSCVIDVMLESKEIFIPLTLERSHVTFLGTPEQVEDFKTSRCALFFDLDGTLVDSDLVYLKVWSQLLPHVNMTKDLFSQYIQGRNDKIAVSKFIFDITDHEIDQISIKKDELFIAHIDDISMIKGAFEFVRDSWIQGHSIFIVTNCNRSSAEAVLDHCGLQKWIHGLVIGNECSRAKPYPDPYLHAMSLSMFPKDRCIIFEDSKTGVLSARSSCPKAIIGILSSLTEETLLNLGATTVISDFKDLDISSIFFENQGPPDLISKLENNILSQNSMFVTVNVTKNHLKGGYIADVIPVILTDNFGQKYSAITKYENKKESELAKMATRLDLYRREYYFYTTVQSKIPINSPSYISLVFDPSCSLDPMGIILQNMYSEGYETLDVRMSTLETTLCIVRRLAKMHSKFWNKNTIVEEHFPYLKRTDHVSFDFMTLFIKERWPLFEQQWSHVIHEDKLKWGKQLVEQFNENRHYLSQEDTLTIVHGDVKYGNILFKPMNVCHPDDKYFEPCFIDWQYIHLGKGVEDIVFFLIESYEIHELGTMASIVFPYYYSCLCRNGVKNYSKTQYEKDIVKAMSVSPFFVAVWFGTTPREDLVDINFPFFYIQKFFHFLSLQKNQETKPSCLPL